MDYIEVTSNENKIQNLIHEISSVIRGKKDQIEKVICCVLAGGHILIEDNPGTGKTLLARSLAHAISGNKDGQSVQFKRVQFTPDLLPMDLLGTHIYDEAHHEFIFKKGPLFCNVLLADEINRASPKVQSALLEAMAENQISIGDKTYILEHFFFTIATQNPIDMEGTYPLPSAQLDRFYMKIYFGYVDEASELEIYENYTQIHKNLNTINQVLSLEELNNLKAAAEAVYIHPELIKSINTLIRSTRSHPDIRLGASTRSGIALIKCLKAFALIKNRNYVIEDDLAQIAQVVLDHRLIYKNKEGQTKALNQLLQTELKRLSQLKIQ